jgi:hypothetical protein
LKQNRNGNLPPGEQTNRQDLLVEVEHLESLLQFLDKEFQPLKAKLEKLTTENKITFNIIWLLFPEGSEVIFNDPVSDLKRAGKVCPNLHRIEHV